MPHLRTTCLSRSLVLTSNSTLCHVYFGTLIAGSARPPERPANPPKNVARPPRRTVPTPLVLRVLVGTMPPTAALMAARQAPASKAPRKSRVSPESPPLLPTFPFPDRGRLLLLLLLLLPPPLPVRGTDGDWAGSSGGARSVPVAGSNVQPDGRRGGTSPARYSCRM